MVLSGNEYGGRGHPGWAARPLHPLLLLRPEIPTAAMRIQAGGESTITRRVTRGSEKVVGTRAGLHRSFFTPALRLFSEALQSVRPA
jgi:hypothetical protein